MAADWDLYAVVRSCKSVVKEASSGVSTNRPSKVNNSYTGCNCMASLKLGEEDDPFTFSNMSKRGYLQDSHNPTQAGPTAMGSNRGKEPSFFNPAEGGSGGQHHQLQQQQPQQPLNITRIPAPTFTFDQFVNQRPPKPLRSMKRVQQPGVPRTRKRKNKNQKRNVCQVTGENLWSDQWSWRKYGQKPIKGSPHPRHYYRCSSSKGCSARKHVERSISDPDIFIVTYTGDHIHSKPRNSHAGGSRRNKLPMATNASSSSFIPQTAPLSVPEDVATTANVQNAGDNGVKKGENVNNVALEKSPVADYDDDEEVILIPNAHVNEDLFEGLRLLMRAAGGGSSSTGIGFEPSWPAFGGNFSSCGAGSSAGRG